MSIQGKNGKIKADEVHTLVLIGIILYLALMVLVVAIDKQHIADEQELPNVAYTPHP